jgi:hypothetical protein
MLTNGVFKSIECFIATNEKIAATDRYCQTPLGKRTTCQSLLFASLLLAQQDDPEPVNQCSQGEKHPLGGLEVLGRRDLRIQN